MVWFGLVGLLWRRRVARSILVGVSVLAAVFLLLPGRTHLDRDALRDRYLDGLRRYEGVTYVWGGEGPTGIDCSGLVRRALVDALFSTGIRTFDPGLVRRALMLWWFDCTAKALGECRDGLTYELGQASSVNQLDLSAVLPGDLAVTDQGVHVMAYLGNRVWIEADPGIKRVVAVPVPSSGNPWFKVPVKTVRWTLFRNDGAH